MREVVIPKLNANDESCTLSRWLVEDGAQVEPETPIAVLETSKAAFDLTAEAPGILHQLTPAGEKHAFGAVIGHVFESEEQRQAFLANAKKEQALRASTPSLTGLTITDGAKQLIERGHLTEEQIRSIGKQVIRQADVEALLAPNVGASHATNAPRSRHQAAVAKIVSHSHATIPAAFEAMKVRCDKINAWLLELKRGSGRLVGLPEALVKYVAGLAEKFPLFFAGSEDGDPNVGVTIDAGKGLFIPVIKSAGSKSLLEVAKALVEYRVKAYEGAFKEEDLTGGHISISLTPDPDILLSVPIIFPGQTCMLSLGGMLQELALSEGQTVVTRSYVHLGLAYDHRFINGRDATQFLTAIKKQIESTAELT